MFDELISATLIGRGAKALEIGRCAPAKKVSPRAAKNAVRAPESAGFEAWRVKNHACEYATNGIPDSNSVPAAQARPAS